MSESSLRLHFRFGNEIESPTDADIRTALAEVFHESHPDLVDGDYVEHPNAWLQFGYENGADWSLIVVDVYRSGAVSYSRWADQDDDDPVVEARIESVSETRANELLNMLLNRRLDELSSEFSA